MSPFRFVIVAGTALLTAAPVVGQTVGQENGVRVHTLFNFFMPGPGGNRDEVRKALDDARRTIYEMARRECDLLREVLAKDCHLESLTTNVGRQYGPYQPEGFTVSGTVSMNITLK